MARPDIDVVIVGAGPAGSTTALALLQAAPELAGRVVMLERARFPRDKPCAGALGARGDALLRTIGVEVDVPSAHVDGIRFRGLEGDSVAAPGRVGRVVRRVEFDHALAKLAAARGAELREGVRVETVRDEGAEGAVVETSAGPMRARVVVGCDGVGSAVRKALGLGPGRLRAQVVEVDTEAIAADASRALLDFDATDRALAGYAWDFPTIVGGRPLVCRGVYRLKVGRTPRSGAAANEDADGAGEGEDVAALLDARLRAQGLDPSRCKTRRYAERGWDPSTPVARGALMLAGEAAGIDPVTGEGIAQAIEYGVLAGAFLARRRRGPVDAWNRELGRSRLARDLGIRTRFVRYFYGPARPVVERFFLDSPDPLYVGCQHFAAQPYELHDWVRLLDVVGRGLATLARLRLGRALAA